MANWKSIPEFTEKESFNDGKQFSDEIIGELNASKLNQVVHNIFYLKKKIDIGINPNLQGKTVYFEKNGQRVTFDKNENYKGLSEVIIISPETLVPENIKKGIVIAGVEGTYRGYVQPIFNEVKLYGLPDNGSSGEINPYLIEHSEKNIEYIKEDGLSFYEGAGTEKVFKSTLTPSITPFREGFRGMAPQTVKDGETIYWTVAMESTEGEIIEHIIPYTAARSFYYGASPSQSITTATGLHKYRFSKEETTIAVSVLIRDTAKYIYFAVPSDKEITSIKFEGMTEWLDDFSKQIDTMYDGNGYSYNVYRSNYTQNPDDEPYKFTVTFTY